MRRRKLSGLHMGRITKYRRLRLRRRTTLAVGLVVLTLMAVVAVSSITRGWYNAWPSDNKGQVESYFSHSFLYYQWIPDSHPLVRSFADRYFFEFYVAGDPFRAHRIPPPPPIPTLPNQRARATRRPTRRGNRLGW